MQVGSGFRCFAYAGLQSRQQLHRSKVCLFRYASCLQFSAIPTRKPTRVLEFQAASIHGANGREATLYESDESPRCWRKSSLKMPSSTLDEQEENSPSATLTFVRENVVRHFLPSGYPDSVTPGYDRFIFYGFCASVCGSAAMVLSTQTLLLAVGVVGSAQQASIMAGALNWVLKDGIGQLGGVLFASHMGKAGSARFDADPKRWRMVAALSLDCSTLIEIISPMVPTCLVLPVASIANIGKNIGFLTASASRAALHQSLALSGNLADVTAKAGSQSLAASLVGTAIGIGISPILESVTNYALGFAVLSSIHLGCNYASLRSVSLASLNRHRLHIILSTFVNSNDDDHIVLSPSQVAEQEFFLPMVNPDDSSEWLSIGAGLDKLCPGGSDELEQLLALCPNERYLVNRANDTIHLVFLEDASGDSLLRGMLHAYLLRSFLEKDSGNAIVNAHNDATALYSEFETGLQSKGWLTETAYISVESGKAYRLRFEG